MNVFERFDAMFGLKSSITDKARVGGIFADRRFPQPILVNEQVYAELEYDWYGTMTHQDAMSVKWVFFWRQCCRDKARPKKHKRKERRLLRKWGPKVDAILAVQIPLHELAWPEKPIRVIKQNILASVRRGKGRLLD